MHWMHPIQKVSYFKGAFSYLSLCLSFYLWCKPDLYLPFLTVRIHLFFGLLYNVNSRLHSCKQTHVYLHDTQGKQKPYLPFWLSSKANPCLLFDSWTKQILVSLFGSHENKPLSTFLDLIKTNPCLLFWLPCKTNPCSKQSHICHFYSKKKSTLIYVFDSCDANPGVPFLLSWK